jgi:[ribosomal protein S18]-alanine N-acetyltransferase
VIPAAPVHAEVLASLHDAALPPEDCWAAPSFAVQLALPTTFGFLDDRGGFILARAVLDEAEILTLAVHPEVRRQGIGRDLLVRALAEAARRGARAAFLEVAASNAGARALYAASGFTVVGRRRGYYASGDDALQLARYEISEYLPECGPDRPEDFSGAGSAGA